MRGGRKRKIEVPQDTQPLFELGDTVKDIERMRERDEREERKRGENRRKGTERG